MTKNQEVSSTRFEKDDTDSTYEKIFELCDNIVLVLDKNGNVSKINPKGCALLGYEPDELIGWNWFHTCLPQPEADQMYTGFRSAMNGKLEAGSRSAVSYYEYHVVTKKGDCRLIRWRNSFTSDERDNLTGTISIGTDITKRRSNDEAELYAGLLIESLMKSSLEGFYVTDVQGICLAVNDEYCKMSGYSREQLVGVSIARVAADKSPQEIKHRIQKLMPKGERRFRTRHRRNDGTVFPVEVNVSYQHSLGGRLLVFVRDMSDEEKVSRVLKANESNLTAIINNADDHIWSVDCNYCLILSNPAWNDYIRNTLGRPFQPGECTLHERFPQEVLSKWKSYYDRTLSGERFTIELPLRFRHGPGYMAFRFNPITGADGRIQGITVFGHDTTERRANEEKLQTSEAQLRASQKIASVGSWILDLTTHDLHWSEEIYEMFGLSSKEFDATYEAFLDVIHPDDRQKVDTVYSQSLKDGSDGYECEHRIVHRITGEVRHVFEKCEHKRDSNGQVVKSTGIVQDITESVRQQKELAAIWDGSPIALFVLDRDCCVLRANNVAARLTGRKDKEAILKLRCGDALGCCRHLEDPSGCGFGPECPDCSLRNAVLKTFETGHTIRGLEVSISQHRSDNVRDLYLSVSTEKIAMRTQDAVLVAAADITDRKLVEDALTESCARMFLLDKMGSDVIWQVDTNGICTYVSSGIEHLLGYSQEESTGVPFGSLLGEDDRRKVESLLALTFSQCDGGKFETTISSKDGVPVDIEFSVSPVKSDGKLVLVQGIARNITEQKRARHELKESEAMFRAVFDHANDGIMMADAETKRLTMANAVICTMLGYTEEELLKLTAADIHPQESLTKVIAVFERQLRREHRFVEALPMKRKDGSVLYVDVNSSPVELKGKQYLIGIFRDITERLAHEHDLEQYREELERIIQERTRELRESELLFRTVADNTYDWEYWRIPEEGLRYVSPSVERITGRKPAEFYTNPDLLLGVVHPDDRDAVRVHMYEHGDEDFGEIRFRIVHTDGSTYWIHHICQPIHDDNGESLGIRASNRDVTDQVVMEIARQQSELMFQQLARSINEIFFLVDVKTRRFLYVSPAVQPIMGLDPESLKGEAADLLPLIDENDRTRLGITSDLLADEKGVDIEFRIATSNGTTKWLRLRTFPVAEDNSSLHRIAGIATDITVHKAAAEKERIHVEQLQQADKMASLGILVSGVAHEINNPNNFIMLNTPILRQAWEDAIPILSEHAGGDGDLELAGIPLARILERASQMFGGIERGAKRIRDIVNDLKNYARKDSGLMDEVFDAGAAVSEAVNLLKSQIGKTTDCFMWNTPSLTIRIKGNRQRFEQVIINLIQNACDAIESKDRAIEVRLDVAGKESVLTVRDEGNGISPENLKRLTDPFFTTRRDKGGTGLGLSVSAGIVKDHKGILEFESELGKGTVVRVRVPVTSKERQ